MPFPDLRDEEDEAPFYFCPKQLSFAYIKALLQSAFKDHLALLAGEKQQSFEYAMDYGVFTDSPSATC